MNGTLMTLLQADPSVVWIPVSVLLVMCAVSVCSAVADTVSVISGAVRRARGHMTARGRHAGAS